jgi:hypothetical protein
MIPLLFCFSNVCKVAYGISIFLLMMFPYSMFFPVSLSPSSHVFDYRPPAPLFIVFVPTVIVIFVHLLTFMTFHTTSIFIALPLLLYVLLILYYGSFVRFFSNFFSSSRLELWSFCSLTHLTFS